MWLFRITEAEDTLKQRLVQTIFFNSIIIQMTEGRSFSEAEYLSICTLLDSLRAQVGDADAVKIVMPIVETEYPWHLEKVIEYSARVSGSG